MKSEQRENFLRATKEDSPAIKLFKYRSFIQQNPTEAAQIRGQMLKIALDNKLIGEFRQIHELFKIRQQNDATHLKLRQKMIQDAGTLQALQKKYKVEQNYQDYAAILLQLGRLFFTYGDYEQASKALENISMLHDGTHNVKYEDYANELALSFYFQNQSYNLLRFNSKPIDKAILKKMPEICIIKDINNIDFRRNLDKPFDNVLKQGLTSLELSKNRVISYSDLGFLFGMLSVAYKKKKDIPFTKWSSKLEILYLNNKYKLLLETLKKQKQVRCLLPIINKNYEQCMRIITDKILVEVVSSFDRCPFKILEEMTGMGQGSIRILIKNNPSSPLLFDPVTSSIVYKKTAPFYKQLTKLHATLTAKYNEEILAVDRGGDSDDENEMGGLRRLGSSGHSRMGAMGMFGSMGRRRDF